MTTVVVGTHDLRRALTAVRPHHEKHPDLETFRRVRLEIDAHNVTVVATDRVSVGLAIVSIWQPEDSINPDAVLDLTPEQVDKILHIFKAPKDKNDEPSAILRLEIGDNYWKLTDVSGLPGIDGQSLEQPPRAATDTGYPPDIPLLISRNRSGDVKWIEQFATNGDRLAAFRIAGVVYDEPVLIEARTGTSALSITVGESFLGASCPSPSPTRHRPSTPSGTPRGGTVSRRRTRSPPATSTPPKEPSEHTRDHPPGVDPCGRRLARRPMDDSERRILASDRRRTPTETRA